MIRRDADTFVALGRAVALAAHEGALEPAEVADLCACLVAGILSGCMDLDTYGRVHEALARLLDRAFEGPSRPVAAPASRDAAPAEEPLGVYLEVVGEAWERVTWEPEACSRLAEFVRRSFDLGRARFGDGAWFRAPVRGGAGDLLAGARAAGLLVVSAQGPSPAGPLEATFAAPETPASGARVVLGWGERRTALDLTGLSAAS